MNDAPAGMNKQNATSISTLSARLGLRYALATDSERAPSLMIIIKYRRGMNEAEKLNGNIFSKSRPTNHRETNKYGETCTTSARHTAPVALILGHC